MIRDERELSSIKIRAEVIGAIGDGEQLFLYSGLVSFGWIKDARGLSNW